MKIIQNIDIGKQWNIINDDTDIWNDPFNPKWYSNDPPEKKDFDKKDIDLLNQKIQNYIENNKGRKNYLEYCDNNSETINAIKNLNSQMDEDSF